MNRKSRIAAASLTLLLLYYEVYRWIPLGRWNGQFRWPVQNDQFYPDMVIGVLLLVFIAAFLRFWRPAMWMAVALTGLWAGVHFLDWWLPYLQNRASNYARFSFYAQHTQLLPVIDKHYPPDAGHAILDLLLYPAWLMCLIAAASRIHQPNR